MARRIALTLHTLAWIVAALALLSFSVHKPIANRTLDIQTSSGLDVYLHRNPQWEKARPEKVRAHLRTKKVLGPLTEIEESALKTLEHNLEVEDAKLTAFAAATMGPLAFVVLGGLGWIIGGNPPWRMRRKAVA